ncbi:hypothetical protein ACFV0R_09095 [Streptomyces sp. NPDC059578]|uniref:hypothetical protein n=1 Tax=Streptomyces sp. NPDC059578 TaxID=3346874 RepID=UPI0036AFB5E5
MRTRPEKGGPGARPPLCGVVQTLPPTLVLDALTAAPFGDGEIDVMTDLRCELEADHRGHHADAVRLLDGSPPETLWTQWTDWRVPVKVLVLRDCARVGGEDPRGGDDACTLFADHPGTCSFDLFDPEHERFLAAHPAYRYLFAREGKPDEAGARCCL